MTDWLKRIENMGEATSPIPSENLVKPPIPTSTPRQKTVRQLLDNPPQEFNYLHDVFGVVRFKLLTVDNDALLYLVEVMDEFGVPNLQWTTLSWVIKRKCKLQKHLMQQYDLKDKERIIHTGDALTCEYVRARPRNDFVLVGFQKHYGIEPHSVI